MTRARMEGLLDAFPKLIGNDKDSAQRQHTFIETDSVRYVYHPLDNLYMVLITTKTSNILEDLETLRLFSRVIPEYCRSNDEKEILAHDFDLIFAFDEVVTLGYRESVNLAQIRTFTEMDSHEERVFLQIKEAQERAAKQAMAEKAKEFKRMQKEALSKGLKPGTNFTSSATGISSSSTPLTAVQEPAAPRQAAPASRAGGGKIPEYCRSNDEKEILAHDFDLIFAFDEVVTLGYRESVNLAQIRTFTEMDSHEERVFLQIKEAQERAAKQAMAEKAKEFKRMQKEALSKGLKPGTNFTSSATGISSSSTPLTAVQEPAAPRQAAPASRAGGGKILGVVSLSVSSPEFNTVAVQMHNKAPAGVQLQAQSDLMKCAPDVSAATVPVVSDCEGSYEYQKSRNQLVWTMPVIDSTNSTGTLEFNVPNGHADHFFPVHVRFHTEKLYCDIGVDAVQTIDGSSAVPFSVETRLITEKYEVV
ncbi:hypothetical protein TELCIR_01058 [Teladorsagia circumcincta]|uniref:Coatomer subunit delta n=1 Tax=Teladorsagia circumcincta TaxID=45464 RepID=A0A2G9V392_TELCI|nr:hypothetical protein TELCIR_01058 [Teladorsagia circumcincta]